MDKTILSNNRKKYALTQDVNNQCMLDVSIITQAQMYEFSVCTSELKHKVRDNDKYLHIMHHKHEIVEYKNKIYVPQLLHKQILNWYHHYLSHPSVTHLV